jgi:hypothetical protein
LVFVGVADHGGDAGQGGDFFGGALGIASGDDDSCQGILALHAADGGASVLIGGIGDGASVEYDEIGLRGGDWRQTAGFELMFDGGAIGLSGSASEIFDVVGGHGFMVAHVRGRVVDLRAAMAGLKPGGQPRSVPRWAVAERAHYRYC